MWSVISDKEHRSGGCRDSSVSTVSGCEVDKTSPYGARVLELRVHSTMATLLFRGANEPVQVFLE